MLSLPLTPVLGSQDAASETEKRLPAPISDTTNVLAITKTSAVLWNEHAVSMSELKALLEETKRLPSEPELRFEPHHDADYDVSVTVLEAIKESGVTKFGLVGNEVYREPEREQ